MPVPIQNDPWAAFPDAPVGQQSDPWAAFPDAPAPTPAPQFTPEQRADRISTISRQSTGRGIADIAGMPSDFAELGLNALAQLGAFGARNFGGVEGAEAPPIDVPGGSEDIAGFASDMASKVGFDTIPEEQMSGEEKLQYNMGRFASGGLFSGGGLAALAPRLAMRPGMLGNLAKSYVSRPASTVIGDTAAGAGAGTALAGYDEFAPQGLQDSAFDPVARMMLMATGGVAGGLAKTAVEAGPKAAYGAVKGAMGLDKATDVPINQETGQYFRQNDVGEAAALYQAEASNPANAARGIDDVFREFSDGGVPIDAMPTPAAMSDDVGLLRGTTRAAAQDGVPFMEQSRRLQTHARQRYEDTIVPDSEARDFTAFADRQMDTMPPLATNQKFPAAMDIDEAVVEGALKPGQQASREAYDAAKAVGDISYVPADNLIPAATAVRESLGAFNSSKLIPEGLLRRIEGMDPEANIPRETVDLQVSVADLVKAVPEISGMTRAASNAGNVPLAENLRSLHKSFTQALNSAADAGDEAALQWRHAEGVYKDRVGGPFGPGEGRDFRMDFNKDRFERSTTPPSQTAGRFLQPGQPEKADALNRILDKSSDPAAGRKATDEYLRGDLAEAGGKAAPWLTKWGPVVDKVPGLRQEIEALAERQAKFGEVAGKSPDNAIAAVFGAKDPELEMQRLAQAVRSDGEAFDGLKTALTQYLLKKDVLASKERTLTGKRPLSDAKVTNRFEEDRAVLAAVYSPQEMNSLQIANRLIEVENKQRLRTGIATTTSEVLSQYLRPLEVGLKAWFGMLKGGGIFRSTKLAISMLPDSNAAAKQLVEQARIDPELASFLLKQDVQPGSPQWNKKLLTLLSRAEFARAYNEEDKQ
jgi:hypothetical protein